MSDIDEKVGQQADLEQESDSVPTDDTEEKPKPKPRRNIKKNPSHPPVSKSIRQRVIADFKEGKIDSEYECKKMNRKSGAESYIVRKRKELLKQPDPIEDQVPQESTTNHDQPIQSETIIQPAEQHDKKPKFDHAQYWNQQKHANDELTSLMRSVLTRVTKLEKKYMERKAEENDVDVPESDNEPEDNEQDSRSIVRSWMNNM
jgi:hypothetical protein